MTTTPSRHEFFRRLVGFGALLMALALAAHGADGQPDAASAPEIAVVTSDDAFANTQHAIDALGGMGRFVKPGARVALLINAPRWWTKPGSFVSPDVSLAVVKACADAGAREIVTLVDPPGGYWARSSHAAACAGPLTLLKSSGRGWTAVEIPKGKALKHAEVNRALLECDVVVNVSIAKHHAGTGFSGCLKNMMGACSSSTNRFFHEGSGASSEYGDVAFLSQCIADVNLVRKPDLDVCDATEFLLTNGPAGPGDLGHGAAVVAGTDPVAVDAYCSETFLHLRPERVTMIQRAFEHGIGEMDWKKLRIAEVKE